MAQTLLDFDYNKAVLGATLGYVDSDGTTHLATYVECTPEDVIIGGYISFDSTTKYNFTRKGIVYTGTDTLICTLSIISTDITKTTGTRIARVTDSDGTTNAKPAPSFSTTSEAKANTALSSTTTTTTESTEEIFSIATMQPREEIAMHCLEAMIPQDSYPLNFDNTKIKQLVDKAFLFAQEFINQAVLYREGDNIVYC